MKVRMFLLIGSSLIVLAGFKVHAEFTYHSDLLPSGFYEDVMMIGDYIYTTSYRGLEIYQLSPTTELTLVGFIDTTGLATGLYVEGHYAYIADGYKGLVIVDVSDPQEPLMVGQLHTMGTSFAVFVLNSIAYLADDTGGLKLVDITDPTDPQLLSTFTQGIAAANDVVVRQEIRGTIAYVADWQYGLVIVDVTNPYSPSLLSYYSAGDNRCWQVDVYGNYAYVAYGTAKLQVVDISQTVPYEVNIIEIEGEAVGVYIGHGKLSLADTDGYVHLYNLVPNPVNPSHINQFEDPAYTRRVHHTPDYALCTYGMSGVYVINITNPNSFTLRAAHDNEIWHVQTAIMHNGYILAAVGGGGIAVIDAHDPHHPSVLHWINPGAEVTKLVKSGSLAYACMGLAGMRILDLSSLPTVTLRGLYDPLLLPLVEDVAIRDNRAYVAGTLLGLHILDVANPDFPRLLGTFGLTLSSLSVCTDGDYAYLTTIHQDLRIVDVRNPAAPSLVGTANFSQKIGWETEFLAVGARKLGLVAEVNQGLIVVDVTNPASPFIASNYYAPGGFYALHKAYGAYVFAAEYARGVRVLDLSSPDAPRSLEGFDTTGLANQVYFALPDGIAVADTYSLALLSYTFPVSTPTPTPSWSPGPPTASPSPPSVTPTPSATPVVTEPPGTQTPTPMATQSPTPQSAGPLVLLAGSMDSYLANHTASSVRFIAWVSSPHENPIATVELYYDGLPTGVVLFDDGLHGDFLAADDFYGIEIPIPQIPLPPMHLLISIQATDQLGNISKMWPLLTTE